MANVWFVERVGSVWKTLGDRAAFERPLGDLIFKLDLGPQRRRAADEIPERGEGSPAAADARTKILVEVVAEDVADRLLSGYFPGWYDSPYAALEARRRLQ